MINITLRQLRYFDALARELHFGRAAEACAISQPAMSMQIQELEESLGIALVERTRAGVKLTEKGREIAERAARILGDVRNLAEFARHSAKLLTGSLRLGVIPSVAPYMLPPLLPLLAASYPELELHIRETQTLPLTAELLDGRLDVLLLALPLKHTDIAELDLFNDTFHLAHPKARRMSGRVRATPELVSHEHLLLLEEGHCLRDQALAYCSLKQAEGIDTFGASSLSTLTEMVAAGFGITLLPEMCLAVETRGRGLGLMRFVEPQPYRKIGLAWRATSPRKADFIELGRLVKDAWCHVCTRTREIAG